MVEYGSGTVRKHGKTWQGVVSYQSEPGKQRQITKSLGVPCEAEGNKGRPAALKALAEWRAELIEADARPVASADTLRDYCARYLEAIERTGAVEPSTAADYRKALAKLGELGSVPVAEVKPGDVQAWEVGLLDDLSPVTVAKYHRVLKQCMTHAYEVGDIPRSPMLGVKPPKRKKADPNALDFAGVARIAGIIDGMPPVPIKAGVALALYAGLREGEVCALRWRDADIEGGVLKVREAVGVANGKTYLKEPKNGGSRRDIPMPSKLAEVLRERRAEMLRACMAAGVPFSGALFVIGSIDGAYHNPTVFGRKWSALREANGITGKDGRPMRFHDLRHTFATVAIAEGIDVKSVSSLMGHADASMTLNTYASADADAKRRAMEAINAAMARPAPKAEVIGFRSAAGE